MTHVHELVKRPDINRKGNRTPLVKLYYDDRDAKHGQALIVSSKSFNPVGTRTQVTSIHEVFQTDCTHILHENYNKSMGKLHHRRQPTFDLGHRRDEPGAAPSNFQPGNQCRTAKSATNSRSSAAS